MQRALDTFDVVISNNIWENSQVKRKADVMKQSCPDLLSFQAIAVLMLVRHHC